MNTIKDTTEHSIAFWRFPNQNQIYTTGFGRCKVISNQEITAKSGFVFKPFEGIEDTVFLIPFETLNHPTTCKTTDFIDITLQLSENQSKASEKKDYLNAFEQCMDLLQKEDLQKIVLSRTKQTNLIHEKNALSFFIDLTKNYQNAFVYFLFHPEMGCWVGATPEPLLIHEHSTYQTVALAASKKKDSLPSDWTKKEKEEQAYVSNYIREYLQKYQIPFEETLPTPTEAGNLLHLKTTFTIPENMMKKHISGFLDNIHPTPAVCGLPKQKSFENILKNESHKRELYTGYIGTVQENNISLFVNLRCMQVFKDEALIYAGGGLTKASNAESEWEETELKTETLLNIARKI